MKRRFIACWIFGLLVLLLLPVLPVSAVSNTVLKTSVPDSVTLTIEITGKGTVWVGNRKYSDSQSLLILRNKQTEVSVQAATGYRLSSIELNGSDISQKLDNGSFAIDAPNQDMTLSVVFLRKSAIWPGMNPPTGDYRIKGTIILCVFSLLTLLSLLLVKKRKN